MKSFKLTAALLALFLLLSGCGSAPKPEYQADQPVDYAAVADLCRFVSGLNSGTVIGAVNGQDVTIDELLYWIVSDSDNLLDYYEYMGVTEDPWAVPLDPDKTVSRFILDDALNLCVSHVLILAQAQARGLELTQEDTEQIESSFAQLTVMAEEMGVTPQQLLWCYGLTEPIYRSNCMGDYYYSALSEQESAEVDEQAIQDYLDSRQMYRAQHILISTLDENYEPLDEEAVAQKQALAEELLSQIRASEDPSATFHALMEQYSEDPGASSYPDGYLAAAGDMVTSFEDAARTLEIGQISDVVASEYGFHIIRRCPLNVDPEDYRQEALSQHMSDLLAQWADEADVVTRPVFDTLDARSIYEAVAAYRDAVYASAEEEAPVDDSVSSPDSSLLSPDGAVSLPDLSAPASDPAVSSAAG